MQGPRADFACLSKKCQQDGSASVYELPVGAVRCPMCSSKRIQRLYNAINISSGLDKATDRMVEPAYREATARVESVRRAEKQNGPALGVPISGIGAALAKLGLPALKISAPGGGAVAIPRAPAGEFSPFQQQPPRPTVIASDREWTVTRTADGTPVAAKA